MSIDLHVHSTFSDGTMSPKELVDYAKQKGLRAISITDHDTVEGVEEALASSKEEKIEVIPGIEIGARYGDTTVHILAYFFDMNHPGLRKKLNKIQDARVERNGEILKLLQKQGIHISEAELRAVSLIGQTGRPHIARMIINKGFVKSFDEAFIRFLRQGAQAYVPRFVYAVEEMLDVIRLAGGIGVLAHPLQLRNSGINLQTAVKELKNLGLEGIEVYYPTHSKKTRAMLMRYAQEYNLLMTGGSDYHGAIRPGTTLAGGKNVTVPYELLEGLKERAAEFSVTPQSDVTR